MTKITEDFIRNVHQTILMMHQWREWCFGVNGYFTSTQNPIITSEYPSFRPSHEKPAG
jgi:hypothetical protein